MKLFWDEGQIHSVEKLVDVTAALNTEIRPLDKIFGTCFLDDHYHRELESHDVERVLEMRDVEGLFGKEKMEEVIGPRTKNKSE